MDVRGSRKTVNSKIKRGKEEDKENEKKKMKEAFSPLAGDAGTKQKEETII